MNLIKVIKERHIVEEELLAEIAVWMWQNLAVLFITQVALLYVRSQRVDVVEALFPDEDGSTLEAHLTECLLVASFHVPLKGSPIRKLLLCTWTVVDQAVEGTELQACCFRRLVVIVDGVVLRILLALLLEFLVEDFPRQGFVVGDDDFV